MFRKLSLSWPVNTETYQPYLWSVAPWVLKMSPEWRLNPGYFQVPERLSFSLEYRCPFDWGNKYKDYVSIFPVPDFTWKCPVNRCVPKERFSCNGKYIEANFLSHLIVMFIFFFTLLAYIAIPKNRKQRKTLPEIKKINYNKYMDVKKEQGLK